MIAENNTRDDGNSKIHERRICCGNTNATEQLTVTCLSMLIDGINKPPYQEEGSLNRS